MNPVVWGVDVGTRQIALASVDGHTPFTWTVPIPPAVEGDAGHWLATAAVITRESAAVTIRDSVPSFQPDAVWVEQPTGRARNPQLDWMCAVTMLALAQATRAPVWPISVPVWKKQTVGWGNATKQQVHQFATRILQADVSSQDEADAACIAQAGWQILRGRRMTSSTPAVRRVS